MNSESGSRNQNLVGLPKPPDIYSDDRVLLAWHRSHLANERTFLSWSRTSISLLAFGFVIERFDLFIRQWLKIEGLNDQMISHHSVVHLALFSFLLAGISIALSGVRFMQARAHINRGEAIFTVVPDILVIMSVVAIIVIAVVLSLPRLYEILGT
jgi:putative membrane protein